MIGRAPSRLRRRMRPSTERDQTMGTPNVEPIGARESAMPPHHAHDLLLRAPWKRVGTPPAEAGYSSSECSGGAEHSVAGAKRNVRIDGRGHPQRGIGRHDGRSGGRYRCGRYAAFAADLALASRVIWPNRIGIRNRIAMRNLRNRFVVLIVCRRHVVSVGCNRQLPGMVIGCSACQTRSAQRYLKRYREEQEEQHEAAKHDHSGSLAEEIPDPRDHRVGR